MPFSVHTNAHTIDLSNAKVMIQPEQAEGAQGKNVVIGETRPKNVNDKILDREVVLEKAPDGKELIKITVKAKVPGGARKFFCCCKSACCPGPTGQTGFTDRSDQSAPGPTEDFQAQAPERRYLEAECAKDSGDDGCSEINLWPAFE